MQDINGYLIKLTPIVIIGLAYYGYVHLVNLESEDAKVSAEITPVYSKFSGKIEKVLVSEGQEIKSGDVLAQYDDHVFLAAVSAAESDASAAQAKVLEAEGIQTKAAKQLKNQKISKDKFDEIQDNYYKFNQLFKLANEKIADAKQNLKQININSAQDGTVYRKYIEEGMLVSERQKLFDFVAAGNRRVIGRFSASEVDRIKPGTIVSVKIPGMERKTYRAEVESVFKRNTATFAQYPPEAGGPDLSKSSTRTVVKARFLNLSKEDNILLQEGLPVTILINSR